MLRAVTGPAFVLSLAAAAAWGDLEPPLELALGPQAAPFEHVNGMTGELYFPEMTGGGAAWFDYDGDGDLDLYLVQGGPLDDREGPGAAPGDVLLRNDSTAAGVAWVDVSVAAGIEALGYGMAVATGDFDGDSDIDLLVGNFGPNQLWRNRGDGSFEDNSLLLQESAPSWTTGAAFFDFDDDGFEDLYVVNYVDYSLAEAPACYALSSRQDYCGPAAFASQPDRLLRNTGGARFEDVSRRTGVAAVAGSGLGAAVLDVDGDGRLDLYVSNDGQPNFLWRMIDDAWTEDSLLAGVAVNGRGEPEAGMGIAVGDFDRDGDEDLLVAHLTGETNTLYANRDGLFDDVTNESGLAAPSLPYTAFGVAWVDLDHDGWLDLAVVNGAVRIQEDAAARGETYPLGQPNQLFVNRAGRFWPVEPGPFASPASVGRGLARGDFDNDGDEDLLVLNNAGPAELFVGSGAVAGNWLGVSFSRATNQSVTAHYIDGSRLTLRASSTGSYASAGDPRVVIAGAGAPRWLDFAHRGATRRLLRPPLGHYLRIER